ncbi:homing endonuclease associated repeat-containing protein [Haladaptatus cibarius]|uniref:homing endonuclease associated repeat-containing protein n=1 Tax=Haladaptatus cibarius TaxID=453847 RepID=UPI000678AAA6|nr:HNH endonuclease [Haladaptatus cibarius]
MTLQASGFETNHENGISNEELIRALREFAEELGRPPKFEEMNEHGEYSAHSYFRQFGSWPEAKEAAGLDPKTTTSRRISRDELVEALVELESKLGKTPSQEDMCEHGRYSHQPYYREFNSWEEALVSAGIDPEHELGIPKEELIEELQRLTGSLGKTPTWMELTEHGQFSIWPYLRAFGSWNDALRASNLAINKAHGVLDGAIDYGPNWPEQRELALERDRYVCQDCGISDDEQREAIGEGLHVHHLKKRRKFDSYKKANQLKNLISLCRSCHYVWESSTLKKKT